jgi:hypothetical protein
MTASRVHGSSRQLLFERPLTAAAFTIAFFCAAVALAGDGARRTSAAIGLFGQGFVLRDG